MEKSQPFIEKDKSVSDKCCANQHLSLERLQAYLQFLRRSYAPVDAAKFVRIFDCVYLVMVCEMGRCVLPEILLDDAEEDLKQGRYEEAERKLKEVDNLLRKAKKFGMTIVVLIVIIFVGSFVVAKYGK